MKKLLAYIIAKLFSANYFSGNDKLKIIIMSQMESNSLKETAFMPSLI